MAGYPKIWLLRHGQTEWNAQGRIQGQLDSDLTPLGITQARRQASVMREILATGPRVYVSPLGRAQQTARIALSDTPFTTDARLAEVHAGDWQGLMRGDAMRGWPDLFRADTAALDLFTSAPNGEGFAGFQRRVAAFLGDLSGPSVVVAHGLWGQVLRGLACGLTRVQMGMLANEQGCVYVLEGGRERVLR